MSLVKWKTCRWSDCIVGEPEDLEIILKVLASGCPSVLCGDGFAGGGARPHLPYYFSGVRSNSRRPVIRCRPAEPSRQSWYVAIDHMSSDVMMQLVLSTLHHRPSKFLISPVPRKTAFGNNMPSCDRKFVCSYHSIYR